MSLIKKLSIKIKQLRLGFHCALCAQYSQERLCDGCQQFLYSSAQQSYQCCYCCSLPMPIPPNNGINDAYHHPLKCLCGECLSYPPSFDRTISAYIYQAPLNHLLARFKYQRQWVIGKLLSDLMCKAITQHCNPEALPDMITAVPLHWTRQWQRGFNQSVFFSEQLSQALHIPIVKTLRCTKATAEQKQLTKQQRLSNVKHRFTVDTDTFHGKHIAIIDDVMTTGATANSVAQVLKKAGAQQVSVWVLARTPQW